MAAVGHGITADYSASGNKRLDQRYSRAVFCYLDILDACTDKCPGLAIYFYCTKRSQAANKQ